MFLLTAWKSVGPSAALLARLTMKERRRHDDGRRSRRGGVPERVRDYDIVWARNHGTGQACGGKPRDMPSFIAFRGENGCMTWQCMLNRIKSWLRGCVRDYSIEKLARLRIAELRQADVHLLPWGVSCRAGGERVGPCLATHARAG